MPLTKYGKNALIRGLVGYATNLPTSRVWIGLSTTEPDADGQYSEPSGNGYARRSIGSAETVSVDSHITFNQFTFTATNTEAIMFPEATGAWGSISYYIVSDASTGGNILYWGELTTPVSPVANTVPIIRASELSLTLDEVIEA